MTLFFAHNTLRPISTSVGLRLLQSVGSSQSYEYPWPWFSFLRTGIEEQRCSKCTGNILSENEATSDQTPL
jgi:hypothetical protein